MPKEGWIELNTVPKRVVIHFINDITREDAHQLNLDIKLIEGWENIFFEKDARTPIKSNHQKGHIHHGKYVKHN